MNPKRAKDLLPQVSQELDLPLDLLKDLTDFYWDSIHQSLVSLEHYHILIPNLGTFHIKGDQKLKEAIDKLKLKSIIRGPIGPKRAAMLWAIKEKIAKLEKLVDRFDADKKERQGIEQLRKDVRKIKEDLERQEKDS